MKTFSNKTKKGFHFKCADPFIYRWKGKYYMFSTGDYCPIHVSSDLVNWEYFGTAIEPDEENIDIKGCYAPEVTFTGGLFYLTYSPKGNLHRIYSSSDITAKFTPCKDVKFVGIDGSFYLGENNVTLFRSGDVTGKESDGIFYASVRSPELFATADWKKVTSAYLDSWTEGPFMFSRNGYDYLIFTGNHFLSKGYRLAYCYKKSNEPIDNFTFGGTFLISTQKDFFGLGHAAVVIAPNLDGLVLSFHNLLDEKTGYRECNFTTLTTNGKYLFSNGLCNYPTPVHEKPIFECYGREGLILADNRFNIPVQVGKTFTCELTFYCTTPVDLYLCGYTLTLDEGHCYLKNSQQVKHSQYNFIKSKNSYVVKIENGEFCRIYVNGQLVFLEKALRSDYIALSNEIIPEYTCLSSYAEGSSDKTLIKNIPSRFSAHATETVGVKTIFVNDANYVSTSKDLSYTLNVSKSGDYKIIVNSINEKKGYLSITVDGVTYKGTIPVGTGRNNVLTLPLKKGINKITIRSDCKVCDYEFILAQTEKALRFTKRNCNLLHGDISFGESIITSDYTVAELKSVNYDYTTTFSIDVTNKDYCGGVMIRASDYSYFNNQQKESFFGYLVAVFDKKIHFYKCEYNKTELYTIPLDVKGQTADIMVKCKGNRFEFYVNEEFYDYYQDENAFFAGSSGILSTSCDLKIYQLKTHL